MQNFKSLKQKINTLISSGVQPLLDGVHNYNNPNDDIEAIARERLNTCINCPLYQPEEIKPLQVEDKLLPQASKMKCGECGCVLSFKLRQLITRCDKWEI